VNKVIYIFYIGDECNEIESENVIVFIPHIIQPFATNRVYMDTLKTAAHI